jgi:hypothetical protein
MYKEYKSCLDESCLARKSSIGYKVFATIVTVVFLLEVSIAIIKWI